MSYRSLLLTIGISVAATGVVLGQTFGEITGHVADSSGAVVATAAITATNVNTNAARQTATSGTGDYAFPSLPPGNYLVRIEKAGFKAETSRVEVAVQQTVRLDFRRSDT